MSKARLYISLPAVAFITYCLFKDPHGGAVCSICAAFLHECGHLLALRMFHERPQKLTLGLYGMRLEKGESIRLSYGKECLVALAGPLANLILFGVLWLMGKYYAAKINLGLALFNLLPVRPMDGGQILYALLCKRKGEEQAAMWCKKIAITGMIPMMAMAVWSFLRGQRNYSLLLSLSYVSSLFLP